MVMKIQLIFIRLHLGMMNALGNFNIKFLSAAHFGFENELNFCAISHRWHETEYEGWRNVAFSNWKSQQIPFYIKYDTFFLDMSTEILQYDCIVKIRNGWKNRHSFHCSCSHFPTFFLYLSLSLILSRSAHVSFQMYFALFNVGIIFCVQRLLERMPFFDCCSQL